MIVRLPAPAIANISHYIIVRKAIQGAPLSLIQIERRPLVAPLKSVLHCSNELCQRCTLVYSPCWCPTRRRRAHLDHQRDLSIGRARGPRPSPPGVHPRLPERQRTPCPAGGRLVGRATRRTTLLLGARQSRRGSDNPGNLCLSAPGSRPRTVYLPPTPPSATAELWLAAGPPPPPRARIRLTVETACAPDSCTAERYDCSAVRSALITSRYRTAPSRYRARAMSAPLADALTASAAVTVWSRRIRRSGVSSRDKSCS